MSRSAKCRRGRASVLRLSVLGLAMSTFAACKQQIQVAGRISHRVEAGVFVPIPGALVTFTGEDGVTHNTTSLDPSGMYALDLLEGTYVVQVVHSDYQLEDEPQSFTGEAQFSPYTRNLYMRPRN